MNKKLFARDCTTQMTDVSQNTATFFHPAQQAQQSSGEIYPKFGRSKSLSTKPTHVKEIIIYCAYL